MSPEESSLPPEQVTEAAKAALKEAMGGLGIGDVAKGVVEAKEFEKYVRETLARIEANLFRIAKAVGAAK